MSLGSSDAVSLLVESIRALAIAWRNMTAYPPGHPARNAALENAHRRVAEALGPAGKLVFGVAPDALAFGEGKIESPQAVKLAQSLYRRNVALVTLEEGLEPAELEAFLHILADESHSDSTATAWDALAAAGVRHILLQPVDYSAVSVAEETGAPEKPKEPVSLWDAILRVLMRGGHLAVEGRDVLSSEAQSARGMAGLIENALRAGRGLGAGPGGGAGGERHGPLAAAVSEAVGGYLARARGRGRQITVQQVTEMVRSLPIEMRETVVMAALRQVAAEEADGEAFATLAASVSPDAVLKSLRRLHAEGAKISEHALRLVASLAAPPPPSKGDDLTPSEAEVAPVLDEVRALYGNEDIDRLNAEDQKALFQRVVVDVEQMAGQEMPAGALGSRLDSLTDEALSEQLAWTLLEVLGRRPEPEGIDGVLARLVELFRTFVASDRLESAVVVVDGIREALAMSDAQGRARDALSAALGEMASRDSIVTLLDALQRLGEERAALARNLIELLGAVAARNCLFALCDESNRSRRRRLFDFLASLGPVIVPPATELLTDERWFVLRNMIVLLRAVGDHASLPEIERCAHHPDLRVRLEAIKTLFAFGADVPPELLEEAIHDPDPKLAETAIALMGKYGIAEAAGPLLDVVSGLDLFGRRRSLRLKALKALGELANPDVLPSLGRFLRDYLLLPLVSIEERRAAYRSLEFYAVEARLPYVEDGLRSRDAEIRRICERLSRTAPVPPPAAEEP